MAVAEILPGYLQHTLSTPPKLIGTVLHNTVELTDENEKGGIISTLLNGFISESLYFALIDDQSSPDIKDKMGHSEITHLTLPV